LSIFFLVDNHPFGFHNVFMYQYLPTIVVAVIIAAVALVVSFVLTKNDKGDKKKNKKKGIRGKDRDAIVKQANRRLANNPKDAEALSTLADLYYTEGDMNKAMKTYKVLMDMCATHNDLEEGPITLRYGLAALKMQAHEEAYTALMVAKTMNEESFDLDFGLGYLEYIKKNYEKSAGYLLKANRIQPTHAMTQKYMGQSLFKIKKYKEALPLLRQALNSLPDDREALFTMAQSYYELGQHDQALKIFSHLRAHPQWGPSAALFAGTIHAKRHEHSQAIMDYEIGLKHKDIPQDLLLELQYRLAGAFTKENDLPQAITLLKKIRTLNPNYKDVLAQLKQYKELSNNRNLQTYLVAPTTEFITLCRKLTFAMFTGAKVKIIDISVQQSEYVDIMAEVHTKKWEDEILFRFFRTQGSIGELAIRDFHTRIKDMKAGRGISYSAGKYSEGAVKFVEARLIDLISKDELFKLLQKVN